MKTCPRCGKKFNWWQRAVGEYREHIRLCESRWKSARHENYMAMNCRGCPADCFKDENYRESLS